MKSEYKALAEMRNKLLRQINKGFDGIAINDYLAINNKIEHLEKERMK